LKIAFLNLPNKQQVIRRYMCSYNAPNFLFPPLELMYLVSVARNWNKAQTWIFDAIAEKMDICQLESALIRIKPDMVVFISGFEIFQEDMEAAGYLKKKLPFAKFAAFGHFPTVFAREILSKTDIDFCIMGEPEMTFSELCECLSGSFAIDRIEGLAFKDKGEVKVNAARPRILNLDNLPYPARDLLDNKLYGEPFMKRPFTLIQSARGCPFNCTYCVKSFGSKFVCRSAENIVSEIEKCASSYGIRSFRFIDDTFNANRQRAIDVSRLILDKNLNVEWTALSRADTLDAQALSIMREAGCRRLYIGIESGSQRILDLYKKGYRIDRIKESIKMVTSSGIESVGFFMVGAPGEEKDDFKKSLKFAKELNFDYVVVFKAISYPGTVLFDDFKDKVEFSLFPYMNRLKDADLDKAYGEWERKFYSSYYLRPAYIIKRIIKFLRHPVESIKGLFYLLRYILVPARKGFREDLI